MLFEKKSKKKEEQVEVPVEQVPEAVPVISADSLPYESYSIIRNPVAGKEGWVLCTVAFDPLTSTSLIKEISEPVASREEAFYTFKVKVGNYLLGLQ